ncbi:MAG: bifunctional phosphoribosylaminoimidazolecarboxamide formyltransferase/IMP cyclohydrolase [Anaerolineae bacterium]|nr:bifunctional phosphoribosylaminoimidazolecarboxamide formyltransferase/IMP cyclohydrolase [Anaerolineae bacterium]
MSRRALLSVYDKTGLVEFAAGLAGLGFELVASGGTARALSAAGLPVTQVDRVTGFPEILGGRVKTLHPAIHGGILARRTPEHLAELAAHDIAPVDLVVSNLYPFAATIARPGVTEAEAVEEIDIGGVALTRAAAKNFESVIVICDPADYDMVLGVLREAEVEAKVKAEAKAEPLNLNLSLSLRRALALKAFRHTAAYDAAIAAWLTDTVGLGLVPTPSATPFAPTETGQAQGQAQGVPLPETITLAAERVQLLRYGENPHQQAALYRWAGAAPAFEQFQGKELSYNNIVDLEAAWAMPQEFAEPAVAIIKHTNPSGLASAETLLEAYRLAFACDPVSAYGSIIAANREVDLPLVQEIGSLFVEVLAAPGYTPDALAWLASHKKNCRVMLARRGDHIGIAPTLVLRSVAGGLLAQTPDARGVDESTWQVVTQRQPTEAERRSLAFAWLAAKHVKSNAIVFIQGTATVGVGAGQMNRVDSVYLAARRAGDRAVGAVLGSDAFIPFPDSIEAAAAAGVTAVIQPGGSLRDEEAIAAADRLGMAMVFTGERHFRH